MRIALQEAEKGAGFVSPNPLVGAVAVKNGHVLATAYHAAYGDVHAEVALLEKLLPADARDSTIYVNLEPCCHFGKTAPCTDALIAAKVQRVVIGCEDLNPLIKGRGIQALQNAGIDVTVEICSAETRELNRAFFTYITEHRPWICLKVAQSLDGRIALASGESRWISGEAARAEVHRLRATLDAVMIGSQTLLDDDPLLTVRHVDGRDPVRIILDSRLRTELSSKIFRLFDPQRTWIVTTDFHSTERIQPYEQQGVTVIQVPSEFGKRIDLRATMSKLAEFGITSVLVEGGGNVHASLLAKQLFDRFIVCLTPMIIGSDGRPSVAKMYIETLNDLPKLALIRQRNFGQDIWLEFEKNVHRNH